MVILAVGLTLAKETALGTSPLTAIAAVLAAWLDQSFADMTLCVYILFTAIEIVLEKQKTKPRILMLALQIPVSILFTRVMGVVSAIIDLTGRSLAERFFP